MPVCRYALYIWVGCWEEIYNTLGVQRRLMSDLLTSLHLLFYIFRFFNNQYILLSLC